MRKGIMFDMDNTILRSKINFQQMREDLILFLTQHHCGELEEYEQLNTPAQVVEHGKTYAHIDPSLDLEARLWDIVENHEFVGMAGASLEEGATELIAQLKEKGYLLAIVTNNAEASSTAALRQSDLISFFDFVVTRDQMESLKPSPSGVNLVLERYEADVDWLFVGDSWIDGRAAQDAGVPFIAYQADEVLMDRHQVRPLAYVQHLFEINSFLNNDWKNNRTNERS